MTANKVSYCLNFRCHALVAVQGVEQRPQTIGNFNQVLVQLRHIPLTLTLESSSSNASVQPWRSSWASNTSATSEYCITIVPKKYFSLYLFIRHQTCEFRKKLFSLSGPRILQKKVLYQAPDIVVNPPNEIRGQDSATFQRLGMVAPRRSNLSEVSFSLCESDL